MLAIFFYKFMMNYQFSYTMLESIENNYASYTLSGGIVHIRYHIGISISLDAAVKIVADRLLLQAGESYPVLCDIRGVREVNKAARDYLALEGSLLIKAAAFIVEIPMTSILSKFYVQTAKPPIPTRAFLDFEEARGFLEGVVNNE
ncbi:MAG: hypothetical protein V7655_09255 [Aequorivita antarctica]